ncbi:hypothetical protein EDI_168410 [Entamoeba dispar SAW760]|uniref:Uncharacterized protein n=1 Tax=Entamoeba dispar (strain ATCC PRA-260 / SAW760) TaxID=370354 RepID=B0E9E7_ENTDS|nr:uncharacterized protein EDI_168410 [Entamoeba dispar SAW760]EDR28856.1 hypothetical protein EDI_168410 [Entamoeba dispar SAW760]|eukprot:EDR28856.1 hypothetical protein EDI_168410 [Entamoeba dispar SAW760]
MSKDIENKDDQKELVLQHINNVLQELHRHNVELTKLKSELESILKLKNHILNKIIKDDKNKKINKQLEIRKERKKRKSYYNCNKTVLICLGFLIAIIGIIIFSP